MKILHRNQYFYEKVFRKWFIDSIITIFIFIVSGMLLYLGALYVTKKVLVISQEQSVEHTGNLLDNKLMNLKQDISILTFNDRIISASYINPPFKAEDYYAFHQAGKELIGIYSYSGLEDIYIYYSNSNYFTGCYTLTNNNRGNLSENSFSKTPKEWKEFAKKQKTSSFVKMKDSVYFLCPLKKNGKSEVICLAIVKLDMQAYKELLLQDTNMARRGYYSYIISKEGEVFISSGNINEVEYGYGLLKQGVNYLDEKVVNCRKLNNEEWEYITVMPVKEYLREMYNLRLALYVYLAVIILLAFYSVYVETRKKYSPIQRLRENLELNWEQYHKEQVVSDKKQDVFLKLQYFMEGILHDNYQLRSRVKKEREDVWGQRFSEMVREYGEKPESERLLKEEFGMSFEYGIVLIVQNMESSMETQELTADERKSILIFCLRNIGTELLGDSYRCFFWEYTGITGIIWSDKPETASSQMFLHNIIEEIRTVTLQYFKTNMRITVSRSVHSIPEITEAYMQAKSAFDYSEVTGKWGVILFDESFIKLPSYWKNVNAIQAEIQFMECMTDHNYKKAKENLVNIIDQYSYTEGASIQLLKCRMFGLINMMLNAIEIEKSPEEEQFYKEVNLVQRLFEASSIQKLEDEMMDIIESFVVHNENKKETPGQKLNRIDRYIEAHYKDQALSVQQIAEVFSMSLPYLSKMYKQHKGSGILETIHICRINHAKELILKEPEISLAIVAEKVGYGNIQTMLRLFKKHEKQTPGKYRLENRE
ncbi:helix-turn-helix domain-containing protein [Anaerocolumna sp. MB42-C2]|uniref:helix-turn-helix domain-containing protein n=1 Tax=Anaerocolumna sp. MB42-C2 TaxID=3070997 RepID=UPI0027E0B44B|nr:AraC family transcriptional regulator [Anaerocolumna sp. MB42-C2]WMJ90126.1 AraC family transcriptional regulator [Anaerocolumna sp. MB42-C2]